MVTKWLHLSELGGDPWVLPIWTAINKAVEAKKVPPISKELSELGVHISTRLNVLPRIAARLDEGTKWLYGAATEHKSEHIFTDVKSGVALPVDDDLKYRLIADIDAFLFEINACADLMAVFFELLHAHAGSPIPTDKRTKTLRDILSKSGVTDDWFKMLDRNRNFVAHKGTPYLAIDVSKDGAWNLLVMKENLVKFDQPDKFFTLSQLQAMAGEFATAKASLQEHLIGLFK